MFRVALVAAVAGFVRATVGANPSFNFVVMGDWGGDPSPPYSTVAEMNVAKSMSAQVTSLGANFTLALGDNMYYEGVVDENDARFKETFEDVFTAANLQGPNYKFFVLAGNHDHYGNVTAEVAYTAKSDRWTFPSLYYTFTKEAADGTSIQFVLIDTIILAGNSQTAEEDLDGNELPGPADVTAADDEWTWIENTLAASTADFLIVGGHYPVWSVCEHGPTTVLVNQLKPLLEKYKVSAYLAGHDHCAEYIDEGLGVQHHGIGAAHGLSDSTANMNNIPAKSLKFHYGSSSTDDHSMGAFATVSISSSGMVVKHLDENGKLLFTAPTIAPRK